MAGRWPLARVELEIRRRHGTAPRKGKGRTVGAVDDVASAVLRIDANVSGWVAMLDAIANGLAHESPDKSVLEKREKVRGKPAAIAAGLGDKSPLVKHAIVARAALNELLRMSRQVKS